MLGAEGFIDEHLVKRLKDEVYWIRGVDLKMHEYVASAEDKFIKSYLWLIGVIL